MSKTPEEFQNQTIEFWQPLANRRLTQEDARQITGNLRGFFNLLNAWSARGEITETHPEAKSMTGGIES